MENASHIDINWGDKELDKEEEEDQEDLDPAAAPVKPSPPELTCAKWCPLENCTVLVLGKKSFFLIT